jgi:hypothetical protein
MNHRPLSLPTRLLLPALAAALICAVTLAVSARAGTPITTYYACLVPKSGTLYNVQAGSAPTCKVGDTGISWETTDLASMQAQVASLQTQVTNLSGLPQRVATLEGQVSTLQGQVTDLQTQVASLTTRVTALEPRLTVIAVTPPAGYGTTYQLTDEWIACQCVALPPLVATGTLSNGTTENITGSVTWSSSDPSVARIDSRGVFSFVNRGTVTITATKDGITGTLTFYLT